nr:formylglycine-generating enzyme family protein [uncultured Thiodictyon sp.]
MPAQQATPDLIEAPLEEETAGRIGLPRMPSIAEALSDDGLDGHSDHEKAGQGFSQSTAARSGPGPAKASTSSRDLGRGRRWWWPVVVGVGLTVLGLIVWYQWWGHDPVLNPLLNPPMVHIPAGSFLMGCQPAEKICFPDEQPARWVQVQAFEMGKYEVTFDEWDACVADRGCTQKPSDAGWGRGRRPVIVSWDDAQQYVTWLTRKTGKPYRVPSEAELEYAARAGTRTVWSFGDDEKTLGDYAWFGGNAGDKTHLVGEKRPNPWGSTMCMETFGNGCKTNGTTVTRTPLRMVALGKTLRV